LTFFVLSQHPNTNENNKKQGAARKSFFFFIFEMEKKNSAKDLAHAGTKKNKPKATRLPLSMKREQQNAEREKQLGFFLFFFFLAVRRA